MKLSKKGLLILLGVGFLLLVFGGGGLILNLQKGNEMELCRPINVFISKEGDHGINIEWETEKKCLGYVLYGESAYEIERVAVNTENLDKSTKHQISISGLLSTTTYYFIVISDDNAYGSSGNPISLLLEDIQ